MNDDRRMLNLKICVDSTLTHPLAEVNNYSFSMEVPINPSEPLSVGCPERGEDTISGSVLMGMLVNPMMINLQVNGFPD